MNTAEVKQKVSAAMALLNEGSTTLEKVQSVVGLLKGVNRKLDGALAVCEKNCRAIGLASEGAYIELAAANLPEETEEQKKRKKLLLLFIKSWGELKSEVQRAQSALESGQSIDDSSFWWKMLSAAKGPLAVVTVVAVGVGVMSQTSVEVVIENDGCGMLYASGVGISIPGFSLPSDPIASGQSATAVIPPFSISADGTGSGSLKLKALGLDLGFGLGSGVSDVTFNGESLLGKVSKLDLGSRDTHVLRISCS